MEKRDGEAGWRMLYGLTGPDRLAFVVAAAAFIAFASEDRNGGLVPAGLVVAGWLVHRGLVRR